MISRTSLILVALVFTVAKVDSQDISAILSTNRPLVERQLACVLRRAPCDEIGRTISRLLPEALNNNCGRCTPQQAQIARQLVSFVRTNYPREAQQISQMYGQQRRGR